MARFDPDATFHFKRGPRGEVLFFPRGIWGMGYVVPDETRAESIADRQRVLYRWAHVSTMLVVALSPYGGLWRLAVCVVALGVTERLVRWRLRPAIMGLPTSDMQLYFREELTKAIVAARGSPRLIIAVVVIVAGFALAMSVPR